MRDFVPKHIEGNRFELESQDGSTVADLVAALGAPDRLVASALVDGQPTSLDRELTDGAEVTLMPPFTGGT